MELRKTKAKKAAGGRNKILTVGLLALFLLAGPLAASGVEARLFLVGGFFNFRQPEFGDLYETMPLFGLAFDLYSKHNLGLEAGAFRINGRGETVTLEGEPAVYPVKFFRWTFPLLLKYRLKAGRFEASVGAGPALSVYDESWVGVDLSYRGQKIHFRGQLAADFRLAVRLYLRAGLTWDSLPTGARSLLLDGGRVRLDGLNLEAGLGYRF
ncbi:MAG: hypothetical protein QME69_05430 [Candidatus Saccharicenans sp.]|nr:hypothetical protein [Candidatus Saccharicenans sp.]